MNRIFKIMLISLLISNICNSQISINEIMYAPADATNEWFELFNAGNIIVNIQNWKWKDATSAIRTITLQNILINPGSFIVICQDSLKFKNQFPLMTGIFIQTVWSTLNNSGDNIILIEPLNNRIDSVSYLPAWGGNTGGFSLEKIFPEGASNNSTNWGSSADADFASPGSQNSITPKLNDLIIKSFRTKPLFPVKGETLSLEFTIKNQGQNTAVSFMLNIYEDKNYDSILSSSELLNSGLFFSLNSFDSISYNFLIPDIDTGYKNYTGKIIYLPDDDTLNNISFRRIYVSSFSFGSGGIIINEIMYDPLLNQSEWIEIFNASGQTINLKRWKYKESVNSIILSDTDLFLRPGDYFIMANDSSVYTSFEYLKNLSPNQYVKISGSLSLNNSGENISITDSLNNIIDAVNYNPGWSNPEFPDTKGKSIERINPGISSAEKSNWSSCTNIYGGTPGFRNSIYTINLNTKSKASVSPNPFSPDGDGYDDFTIIKYKLHSNYSQMRVKVFDIKGRLVRTISNNRITGSEGSIIFNGLGDDEQRLRIGIYILLIEAVNNSGGTVDIVKEPIVIAGKL